MKPRIASPDCACVQTTRRAEQAGDRRRQPQVEIFLARGGPWRAGLRRFHIRPPPPGCFSGRNRSSIPRVRPRSANSPRPRARNRRVVNAETKRAGSGQTPRRKRPASAAARTAKNQTAANVETGPRGRGARPANRPRGREDEPPGIPAVRARVGRMACRRSGGASRASASTRPWLFAGIGSPSNALTVGARVHEQTVRPAAPRGSPRPPRLAERR